MKGMGKDHFDTIPLYKVIEPTLDRIAGFSIREMCTNSDPETLSRTEITQPCLFIVNALYWEEAKRSGITPSYLAGHSLGEYNALLAANSFDLQTGLYLVKERGRLMGQAKQGGMAAVLGLPIEKLRKILENPRYNTIDVANYNTPTQIVISCPKDDIPVVEADIMQAGAAAFIPLPVSAAFHSRYMTEAMREFSKILSDVHFRPPAIPVISNVTGSPYPTNANSAEIANLLAEQICSPVLWDTSVTTMNDAGVKEFKEIGPGNTLTRIISQIPLPERTDALRS